MADTALTSCVPVQLHAGVFVLLASGCHLDCQVWFADKGYGVMAESCHWVHSLPLGSAEDIHVPLCVSLLATACKVLSRWITEWEMPSLAAAPFHRAWLFTMALGLKTTMVFPHKKL